MPRGDKTKAPAFAMWKAGKSLKDIQAAIRARSQNKAEKVIGDELRSLVHG